MIEFIEPIGDPSACLDFSVKNEEEIHNIAFNVKDINGSLKTLRKIVSILSRKAITGSSYTSSMIELGVILGLHAKR